MWKEITKKQLYLHITNVENMRLVVGLLLKQLLTRRSDFESGS